MAIPRKQLLHDTRSTWISALRSTSRVEAGRAVPSPPGGSRTNGVRRRTRPQDHQHRGPILLGPDWMERHAPGLGGQMPPLHAPTRTPRPHREPTCPPAFARRLTPPDVRKRMVRVAFTSPRLFRRLALHARGTPPTVPVGSAPCPYERSTDRRQSPARQTAPVERSPLPASRRWSVRGRAQGAHQPRRHRLHPTRCHCCRSLARRRWRTMAFPLGPSSFRSFRWGGSRLTM